MLSPHALALLALVLPQSPATQEVATPVERVEALCREAVAGERLPGMSVAISRAGELVLDAGFGLADLEHGVPATADTVFRIGSVTKQFTAAAVMALVEDGALVLDDPIAQHVDVFEQGEHVVTVRQLLNHTGGFKNVTRLQEFRENRERNLEPEEVLDYLDDQEFDFEPGAAFAYNNGGYLVLGLLVEELGQREYEDFVDQRFFTPLGLDSIQLEVQRRIVPNRARGYGWSSRGIHNADLSAMSQPFAAGALISTARDLVRWKEALLGGRAVSAESVAQMTTPTELPGAETERYGFGLDLVPVHGHPVIGHSGGIAGFAAYLGAVPEDELVIAVLCNQESFGCEAFARRLLGVLLFPEVVEQPLTEERGEQLAGSYAEGELRARVRAKDGRLRVSGRRIEAAQWLHAGELEFRAVGDLSRVLRFVTGEDGGLRLELEVEGQRRLLERG